MLELLVVGGRQKPGVTDAVREWHHYGAGLVLSVYPETGTARTRVEYVSPPEACAADADPSITFKTGTLSDGHLYVPTQTEVLVFEVPSFRQVAYVSHPWFNDVHHVRPEGTDSLLVVNTGLDMVLEIGLDGSVRREWSADDETPWRRFARDVDYRKVVSTKPHRAHPNHVWRLGRELWVTRCDLRDAACLTMPAAPVRLSEHPVHDGLVRDGRVHFTSVNGELVVVDAKSREVEERYDLNAIAGKRRPLGWCRGLEILDDDRVVVGFSRLRPTPWVQAVRWVKHPFGPRGLGELPTRISVFDLKRSSLSWEMDLEPAGMNAIFSIHLTKD